MPIYVKYVLGVANKKQTSIDMGLTYMAQSSMSRTSSLGVYSVYYGQRSRGSITPHPDSALTGSSGVGKISTCALVEACACNMRACTYNTFIEHEFRYE